MPDPGVGQGTGGGGTTAGVAVLGGGVAGLYAAILLARSGVAVTLVERDPSPPPLDPDDSLIAWPRPGVPQFGSGHAVHGLARRILLGRTPDLLADLASAGAVERHFYFEIPEADRQEGDEDLVALLVRRPVFEWVLRRAAESELNLELRSGVRAIGLVGASQPRAVAGVVLNDGSRLLAPWVIDATGQRSSLARWSRDLGAVDPELLVQRAGTAYYARHFRRTPAFDRRPEEFHFGPSGDLGFLRYSVLEEDSDGFVVTLNVRVAEQGLRGLHDEAAWMRVASVLPWLKDWVAPAAATPISGVLCYSGQGNLMRRYRPGSVVDGLVSIGDALCQTNPTQGWGVSIGLHEAGMVADAVTAAPITQSGRDETTRELVAALERFVQPYFDAASGEDRERARHAAGEDVDVTDPTNALFCRKVAYPYAVGDPALFRAVQRRIHLLDDPGELPRDRRLLARAAELMREQPRPGSPQTAAPAPPEPPTPEALVSLLRSPVPATSSKPKPSVRGKV